MTYDRRYEMKVKENPYLWMFDISFIWIYGGISVFLPIAYSVCGYSQHCYQAVDRDGAKMEKNMEGQQKKKMGFMLTCW